MDVPARTGLVAVLASLGLALLAPVASAHSYSDPSLRTVFDGVTPTALPAGVRVAVAPSIVDELVVTNTTSTPLEVLALGGEPFLRISSAGVQANLASPDWYTTATPEGGPIPPADVQRDRGKGTPRWALVSRTGAWSEFDSRLHPPAAPTAEQRKAGKEAAIAVWRVPLRYGVTAVTATGHVLFSPIRGGLTVAVAKAPTGLTANALQGELPGIFLRVPAGKEVLVEGRDGLPYLRFRGGVVEASTASRSYVEDQEARGRAPEPAGHWTQVGRGLSYSWLDGRLRFPSDLPSEQVLRRRTASVVGQWSVPVSVDAVPGAVAGIITWVPRSVALAGVGVTRTTGGRTWWPYAAGGAVVVAIVSTLLVRRRRSARPGSASSW
jgi:hypothetical protein